MKNRWPRLAAAAALLLATPALAQGFEVHVITDACGDVSD